MTITMLPETTGALLTRTLPVRDTSREPTRRLIQPVHVTLVVCGDYRILGDGHSGQSAMQKSLLPPDLRARAGSHSDDFSVCHGDV